jgi:hypothetical protein
MYRILVAALIATLAAVSLVGCVGKGHASEMEAVQTLTK